MNEIDPEAQRQLAGALFNRTWDLIEQTDRTADDDVAMLVTAAASRFHWGEVGGPEQIATGDWQVAHVASLLGLGDLALLFAERSLAANEASGATGWQLASAHEGMARACATAGDPDGRERHLGLARDALAHEPDGDERAVIEEQLATVPDLP